MRARRGAEEAPARTRKADSPAPRSRAKPASEAPARSRRGAEDAPTRSRRTESPAPRSRSRAAPEAPPRSRRGAEETPTRSRRAESPAPRSRSKAAPEAPTRSRRSAEDAPTRSRRAESPAPRSRSKPAPEAPTRSRRSAEDAPTRSRRTESPAPRSRARLTGEAPTRSRRTTEGKPVRSAAAKPRAARSETVAAKPMRGAARAPSRPAAPHLVPARPMPEAKVIRRPVGVPPKPVPQEEPSPRKRQVIAGPEAKPARRPRVKEKAPPDRLEQLVTAAQASLEDDKAEDILVLDVTDRASFTDRMIIATGLSERQIQAMANHLEDALEKVGLKLRRDAIQGSEDWVLIDCGDLVIHLFKPEARVTYALERMWGPDSPQPEDSAPPPEGPGEA